VWQVGVAIAGIGIAYQQHKVQQHQYEVEREQSHDYIIEKAADKIMSPFNPPPFPKKLIARQFPDDIAKRLVDADDQRTTIIAGQFQVGKTTLVETTLRGQKGVVKVTVDEPGWKLTLFKSVGVNDKGLFFEAMQKARNQLDRPPLLYLDVPRYSTANMNEVSMFCKELVTDEKVARGVVVASQLSVALGFDAGGKERQYDVWVAPMTHKEAYELLTQNFPEVQKDDAEKIIKEAGGNPGTISGIAFDIKEKGVDVDAALKMRRRACEAEVDRLHAIKPSDSDGKLHPVGQQITKALLKSDVDNKKWDKQGIPVKAIAEKLKQMDAFAVTYHTVEKKWHFASPMHRKVVQDG
jgi:hypothetical protein